MFGISTFSVLPMRAAESESSEMISQLLFGEFFRVEKIKEKWCYIHSFLDDYRGWVDRKMVSFISEEQYNLLASDPLPVLIMPYADVEIKPDNETILLSAGSLLPGYADGSFTLMGKKYYIPEEFVALPALNPEGNLVSTAFSFLNVPYLWGGKTVFGMDCSGFVQIVFRINGILLPRDAQMQVLQGDLVAFDSIKPGDLAFFENAEGKIVHVGICLGNGEIVHESGKVHVDQLHEEGIYNAERGVYTSKLKTLRRYF